MGDDPVPQKEVVTYEMLPLEWWNLDDVSLFMFRTWIDVYFSQDPEMLRRLHSPANRYYVVKKSTWVDAEPIPYQPSLLERLDPYQPGAGCVVILSVMAFVAQCMHIHDPANVLYPAGVIMSIAMASVFALIQCLDVMLWSKRK